MERDLIDEYRLMVFPVVVGKGKRLFENTRDEGHEARDTEQVGPDGVLVLTYRPSAKEAEDRQTE